MENQKENQINIELTEDVAQGTYSNLAVITHSQSEFVADFIQMMPGVPKAKVRSRIIMNPENAKRLMHALADNLKKYEDQFGKISGNNAPAMPPINFGTPTTEA